MGSLSPAVADESEPEAQPGPRRLPLKLLYGIGAIAFGVKDNGFQVLLLLFYNQSLGLDARLAGLAIMIALVVDACVDPTIGYLSDRLRSRWGRRHPFMYAAALPISLSYWLLFSPPAAMSQWALFAYLLVVSILVRILISLYEIPSSALIAELTYGYDERTSFLSFRYFFGWTGGLSMSILAFSIFLQADASHAASYLNPVGYGHYGVAASIIMFCSIILCSVGTQSAVRPVEREAYSTPPPRNMLTEVWSVIGSRSAITATLAGMLLQLATGLTFALGTYFNIYAWQLNPNQISLLTGSGFVSASAALFLSPWLARRFDKRNAAVGVTLILLLLLPLPLGASLAGLLPTDQSVLIPMLFAYNILIVTLFVVMPTLIDSMMADVVEEVEVRTGERAEGVIFALSIFVRKCASGLGVFVSTAMLGLARFPSHAQAGLVDPAVITRLSAIYIVSVASLYAASMSCIFLYQITRTRHVQNLDLLAHRRAQTGRAVEFTDRGALDGNQEVE